MDRKFDTVLRRVTDLELQQQHLEVYFDSETEDYFYLNADCIYLNNFTKMSQSSSKYSV